jgi:predicted dehydrogenase
MSSTLTPLRVGIIGFGTHARQVLLPALEQIPDLLRPVALATSREETARAAQELYRLPCHVGYEALLADPNVEAVINIAGGDHEAVAIAALEAGKPIFNETPAIRSEEGAARIRQLSAEKGLTYAVGSCLRHAPVYQKLRELLCTWREEEPGPRLFTASYYFSSSHFHNLLLFLGGEIRQVLHVTGASGGGSVALARFASGDLASVRDCSFRNWSPPYESVEVAHESGLLVAEDGRTLRFHRASREVAPPVLSFDEADGQFFQTTYSIPYGRNRQLYLRGYVPELADFAHCVRTGTSPVCGVDDALATLRVGAATRRSRESGGDWVDVTTA